MLRVWLGTGTASSAAVTGKLRPNSPPRYERELVTRDDMGVRAYYGQFQGTNGIRVRGGLPEQYRVLPSDRKVWEQSSGVVADKTLRTES